MKVSLKKLSKSIIALMVLLLTLTVLPSSVAAEGESDPDLGHYEKGHEISGDYLFFGFKKELIQTDIPTSKLEPSNPNIRESYPSAYYPEALDYFGKKLSVKVDITYLGSNDYGYNAHLNDDNENKTGIWVDDGTHSQERIRNSIRLIANGADYEVTISFFVDKEYTIPFNFDGAVSFQDPDQADYLFPTAGREIYYTNKDGLKNEYIVKANGLFRKEFTGGLPDEEIGVLMTPADEGSFTFTVQGRNDWIYLPDFIMVNAPYKVEYYYQNYTENPDGTYSVSYPDEPNGGIDERNLRIYNDDNTVNTTVDVTDADKIPQRNGYSLDDDYTGKVYSLEINSENELVLKVYFERNFRVTYHDNVNKEIFADQEKDNYVFDELTNKFILDGKDEPERYGYEFRGWSTDENADPNGTYPKSEDIAKIAVQHDEDYYAIWKPLDYTINYDKNNDDATGTMNSHSYPYTAPTMNSHTNEFESDKYAFLGFTLDTPVYNTGDKLYQTDDFKDVLISTEKQETRSITLFAQWDPIYKIIYDGNGGYVPGKEGEMDPNIYYGSSSEMPSSENQYEKKGYKWVGFKSDYDGKVYTDINDFIEELKKLGAGGVIKLTALWEKLPVEPYALPITGVDR